VAANLQEARLAHANLQKAKLEDANLQQAFLFHADLRGAYLEAANLREAYLFIAKLDEYTTLPDEATWTPDTDMARFTDPDYPDFWLSDDEWSPAYLGKDDN
jgi:hypothetical protein